MSRSLRLLLALTTALLFSCSPDREMPDDLDD